MELKRQWVQDLASTTAAAKSLTKFKREISKLLGKKTHDDRDNDGDKEKSPRLDKPISFKDKGRDKKDKAPRKYLCFLCNGPHQAFKCSKHGRLVALVMEEKRHEQEMNIASILLLSVIQSMGGASQ